MDIYRTEQGDDWTALELRPGRDDRFEISGYGERGEIRIRFALYDHEADELRAALNRETPVPAPEPA